MFHWVALFYFIFSLSACALVINWLLCIKLQIKNKTFDSLLNIFIKKKNLQQIHNLSPLWPWLKSVHLLESAHGFLITVSPHLLNLFMEKKHDYYICSLWPQPFMQHIKAHGNQISSRQRLKSEIRSRLHNSGSDLFSHVTNLYAKTHQLTNEGCIYWFAQTEFVFKYYFRIRQVCKVCTWRDI